ncbi:MAG TPA: GGDEF domain-containing protein, partial [Pseudomonadales bacterium]|nr:GGDEF domain-containing protein [Pseudomonadales bacterium]
EATEMLVISREILWAMINESHGVSRNLLYLLSRRIRSGNAAVVDSKQLQRQSERHANIDALTGLYNRRWLDSFFARVAMRESHEPVMMSIVLVDVDHFKRFNDEYGHLAGDQVLRSVADALRESVRPQDFVVRYGGEEFMLLLPRTRVPDASRVAERVRKTIAQLAISLNGNPLPSVTISLGVAELNPNGSIETAIEHADAALYRAKGAGRNQVCYHQAPSN